MTSASRRREIRHDDECCQLPLLLLLSVIAVKSNSSRLFLLTPLSLFPPISFRLPSPKTSQAMPTGNTKKIVKKPGDQDLTEQSPTPISPPTFQEQPSNKMDSIDPRKTTKQAQDTTKKATQQATETTSGITDTITGAAKPVTSTLGSTIGGLADTVGGTVGAATRGLGETVNSAIPGGMGRPVGDAVSNLGSGVKEMKRSEL